MKQKNRILDMAEEIMWGPTNKKEMKEVGQSEDTKENDETLW